MFDIDQFIDSCESMKINEWDYEVGMEGIKDFFRKRKEANQQRQADKNMRKISPEEIKACNNFLETDFHRLIESLKKSVRSKIIELEINEEVSHSCAVIKNGKRYMEGYVHFSNPLNVERDGVYDESESEQQRNKREAQITKEYFRIADAIGSKVSSSFSFVEYDRQDTHETCEGYCVFYIELESLMAKYKN